MSTDAVVEKVARAIMETDPTCNYDACKARVERQNLESYSCPSDRNWWATLHEQARNAVTATLADSGYFEMREALEPFAKYAEVRERQPMLGLGDDIHVIHSGTDHECAISLSHCKAARAALAKAVTT